MQSFPTRGVSKLPTEVNCTIEENCARGDTCRFSSMLLIKESIWLRDILRSSTSSLFMRWKICSPSAI